MLCKCSFLFSFTKLSYTCNKNLLKVRYYSTMTLILFSRTLTKLRIHISLMPLFPLSVIQWKENFITFLQIVFWRFNIGGFGHYYVPCLSPIVLDFIGLVFNKLLNLHGQTSILSLYEQHFVVSFTKLVRLRIVFMITL